MSADLSSESFKTYIYKELSQIDDSLHPNLQAYLTELLYSYLTTQRWQSLHQDFFELGLGPTLIKINRSSKNERLFFLKNMGDFTLYISGFFRKSFLKKIVSRSYYEALGQNAYFHLASAYGSQNSVFGSLAESFPQLSENLSHLQERTGYHQTYLEKILEERQG